MVNVMNEKWTVILRTQGKDCELELKNALNSLVAQEYKNLSVILTIHTKNKLEIQNTLHFIRPFQKMISIEPIIVKNKQGNRSYPLNVALQKVDSQYLSFLDDDDIYYANFGKDLIHALKTSQKKFAFGSSIDVINKVEENFTGEKYLYTVSKSRRKYQPFNICLLMLDNFIPFNSFLIDTSIIDKTKFNQDMPYLEDWDFIKNLSIKKDFSYIQIKTPVSEYRRRNDDTDTYNEKTYYKWVEANNISRKNFEDKMISIKIKDLYELKDLYLQTINQQDKYIKILEHRFSNKIIKKLKQIGFIDNTLGKIIRRIRHIVR